MKFPIMTSPFRSIKFGAKAQGEDLRTIKTEARKAPISAPDDDAREIAQALEERGFYKPNTAPNPFWAHILFKNVKNPRKFEAKQTKRFLDNHERVFLQVKSQILEGGKVLFQLRFDKNPDNKVHEFVDLKYRGTSYTGEQGDKKLPFA